MKRYYFYKKENVFTEKVRKQIISFSLQAYYSEKAYSQKSGKEITRFLRFDDIDLKVEKLNNSIYDVSLDSGTDSGHGSGLENYSEFIKDRNHWKFNLISERDYFRLRKLAIRLILKNINFNVSTDQRERKYFLLVNGRRSFYDFELLSASYKYNLKNLSERDLNFHKERNWKLYDTVIDERFKLFISKEEKFKSVKYDISSVHFNQKYYDFDDMMNSLTFSDCEVKEVTYLQFERLKKLAKKLVLENSDLDISDILNKQEYSVTILDL